MPALVRWAAMAAPMVPAPMTAARRMVGGTRGETSGDIPSIVRGTGEEDKTVNPPFWVKG